MAPVAIHHSSRKMKGNPVAPVLSTDCSGSTAWLSVCVLAWARSSTLGLPDSRKDATRVATQSQNSDILLQATAFSADASLG